MQLVKIVNEDITEVKASAIVNAANPQLRNGAGVCGAIYAKAGPELQTWSEHYMRNRLQILVGEAAVSPSFDMDNCDKIIHTVGPIYNPDNPFNEQLLECAYHSALIIAQKLQLDSIAFPAISTGVYGYPVDEALKIVKKVLLETSYKGKIILVCYSDSDYYLYKKTIKPVSLLYTRAYRSFL